MVILEMAGAILVGAVIVFVGVWMLQGWNTAGPAARSVMAVLLAAALGAAAISVFKVVPSKHLWRFGAALSVFLACPLLLCLYRVRRDRWALRPANWRGWLTREIARTLFLPLAIVVVVASVASTIVLFAAMQKGPQPNQMLFELSIVTAACWAVVTVGGVWAGRRVRSNGTDADVALSRQRLAALLSSRRRW